jgi:hypothetical protein
MLQVECKEHFDEVKEFANKIGMGEQLQGELDYLDEYAGGEDTLCQLYRDFAPYSFGFTMQKRNDQGQWVKWFIGGLIFHGAHDNGGDGGAPTFSVNLTPCHGWQVHT